MVRQKMSFSTKLRLKKKKLLLSKTIHSIVLPCGCLLITRMLKYCRIIFSTYGLPVAFSSWTLVSTQLEQVRQIIQSALFIYGYTYFFQSMFVGKLFQLNNVRLINVQENQFFYYFFKQQYYYFYFLYLFINCFIVQLFILI